TRKAARAELKLGCDDPLILVHECFNKVKLCRALETIADTTDTNIVLDIRVKAKADTEVSANFTNVPLDTAVSLLADMADLAVVRRNNVLYVTSPENAAKMTREKK